MRSEVQNYIEAHSSVPISIIFLKIMFELDL